jgi:hypothetical protein
MRIRKSPQTEYGIFLNDSVSNSKVSNGKIPMMDHYQICLAACVNGQQIDALVNKAFERLTIQDFTLFLESAIQKLDSLLLVNQSKTLQRP